MQSASMDMKQIFFTNLRLLGFDPVAMERKWRIPFNREMFTLPNKKGFETVMYFLFNRLNSVKCREEFRDCWPVTDKKQEQQFRKVCNNWLSQIAKDDPDAHLPRIVASLFMSPGGDRFYQMLLCFSRFVIFKVLLSECGIKRRDFLRHPVWTSQTTAFSGVMARTNQCGAIRHRKRFLQHMEETLCIHEEWKTQTSEMVKLYRNLSKEIRELERLVKSEVKKASEQSAGTGSPVARRRTSGLDYDFDVTGVKRAQKVQKVRSLWKIIEELQNSKRDERDIIESVLLGNSEKYKIDASELNVKIPDMLLRECEKEIQRRNVDNIYEGGKLNLLSLIHIWNLSLHLVIENLHQAGVRDFEEARPIITTHAHTHHAHLSNAEAIKNKLEKEMLPKMKASIEDLRMKLDSAILQTKSPGSIRTTSIGLGLLPPTPPVTFQPFDGESPDVRRNMARHHQPTVPTPEAASNLMATVSQKIRSERRTLVQGSPVYAPRERQKEEQSHQAPRASKLPQSRHAKYAEEVQNSQRTRVKSAPDSLAKAAWTNSKIKKTPVKLTESGTKLEDTTEEHLRAAQLHLTSQAVRAKPVIKHSKSKKTPSDKVALTTDKRMNQQLHKRVGPQSEQHVNSPRPHSPKAHAILAEQIVDAVMSTSPRHDVSSVETSFLEDPTAELVAEAFKCRDKLRRTPPKEEKRRAWNETLLCDSVGPLSSTRLDPDQGRAPFSRTETDKIATKLFAENFGEESGTLTLGEKSSSSNKLKSPSRPYEMVDYEQECAPDANGRKSPSTAGMFSSERVASPSLSSIHSDRFSIKDELVQEQPLQLMTEDQPVGDVGLDLHLLHDTNNAGYTEEPDLREITSTKYDTNAIQFIGNDKLIERSPYLDNPDTSSRDEMLLSETYRQLQETLTPQLPLRNKTRVGEDGHQQSNINEVSSGEQRTPEGHSGDEKSVSGLTVPVTIRTSSEQSRTRDRINSPTMEIQHNDNRVNDTDRENPFLRTNILSKSGSPLSTSYNQINPVSSPRLGLTSDNQSDAGSELSRDDLEGQSARLVELQNGSFTEEIIKSPNKADKNLIVSQEDLCSNKSSRMEKLLGRVGNLLGTNFDTGADEMEKPAGSSPTDDLRETAGSVNADDLIARYKQLRLRTQTETGVSTNTVAVERTAHTPPQNSPKTTNNKDKSPVLSDKYFQVTPKKVSHVQTKFSLDLDELRSSPHKTQSPATNPGVLEDQGIQEDHFTDIRQTLLQMSPLNVDSSPDPPERQAAEGTESPSPAIGPGITRGTPTTTLDPTSSLSPLEQDISKTRSRRKSSKEGSAGRWEDIFGEDDSILISLSPEAVATTTTKISPPTATLIDI